jgi:hypothetical protein
MPTPISTQPRKSVGIPSDSARTKRPAEKIRFDIIKRPRPPVASIRAPADGPIKADTAMATEKAAKTQTGERRCSSAIGTARTAGR